MQKIGLSYQEIDAILKEAISSDKIIDADALRNAIASAIIENNKKIEESIKNHDS